MIRELNKEDETLLEELLKRNEIGKMAYLIPILKQYYDEELIKVTPDYITVLYDGPVCLVAHLDCVQEDKTNYQFIYDRERGLATSIHGLGMDDAAGIAMIIKLLRAGYRFPILFPCGEEVGMTGTFQFTQDYYDLPWPSLKYFMELDRRGSNDLVTYEYNNPEFDKYIESFGYFQKNYGTCSDISILSPCYEIASCNLSIGYSDEHTLNEVLNINDWLNIYDEICLILDDRNNCPDFEYIEQNIYNYYMPPKGEGFQCSECGASATDLEWVQDENGFCVLLCKNCIQHLCNKCEICGDYYIPSSENSHMCPTCMGEMDNIFKFE